jgi:hypothetical protein
MLALMQRQKREVYVVCGSEFEPKLTGRITIIKKALYGLKSSDNHWHSHFTQSLYPMGFKPTRLDCNVWIRKKENGEGYDYITT